MLFVHRYYDSLPKEEAIHRLVKVLPGRARLRFHRKWLHRSVHRHIEFVLVPDYPMSAVHTVLINNNHHERFVANAFPLACEPV